MIGASVLVCAVAQAAVGVVAGRGASADPTVARVLGMPVGQLAGWVLLAVFTVFMVQRTGGRS